MTLRVLHADPTAGLEYHRNVRLPKETRLHSEPTCLPRSPLLFVLAALSLYWRLHLTTVHAPPFFP
jgi:hypothetical protein